jgi:hypothetical protein
MADLSPRAPKRTAVHAPESAGSAVDYTPNALATGFDTSGDEEPEPSSWTEILATCFPAAVCQCQVRAFAAGRWFL